MLLQPLMLAALLQLGSGGPAATGAPSEQATTSSTRAVTGVHGLASGGFALPTPQGPGAMHGVLRGPMGTPLFAVHAHVLAGGSTPGTGELRGVLVRLVGPNPGPVAKLAGHWRFDPNAPDEFIAGFFIPGDPSTGTPPTHIGGMRGRFHEPNGPLPPAGAFHGIWHVQ